jgi:predicted DNA-binding transcriptional regulator YafY
MSAASPTVFPVNRTDRLYAIAEDLRAISPRCRSARELALRFVEPGVFVGGSAGAWYPVAWCRLRDAVRVFRFDRIAAALTDERAPKRPMEAFDADVPDMMARCPVLD